MSPSQPPTTGTRRALIDAAIRLFGQQGYASTSTRAIAQAADTNVASIAYHFGSKEALRVACAEELAANISSIVEFPDFESPPSPETAERILKSVLAAFVRFLVNDQKSADLIAFVLRELAERTPAFDAFFRGVIAPRHSALCQLWSCATGAPADSDSTRLAVFAMMGQALYFRIGQFVVLKQMGWEHMDDSKAAEITEVLTRNLEASIAAHRKAPE